MPSEPDGGPSPGSTHRRHYWAGVAAVTTGFLVSGLVIFGFSHSARSGPSARQPGLSALPAAQPARVAANSATPAGNGAVAVAPGSSDRSDVSQIGVSGSLLVIPALNVRAPLVPTGAVGAPETASLTIPADIHTVGWWDGTVHDGDRTVHEEAPAPGQPGVAVIAGHVDSATAGPGALFDLRKLEVGDIVEISDSAGHQSNWIVDAAPQSAVKTQLPPSLWVTTGTPKLALVTCGGPFDPATGHYVDNVIVWARQLR